MNDKDRIADIHGRTLHTSYFRFYEELNDFLPSEDRKKTIEYRFTGNPSVKDTIEAIGVPHSEIDLILINGNSVKFSFRLQGGEYISVYPVFESFDITETAHLRSKPLRKIKFICDVNLGRLTRKLRLLGIDALYSNQFNDHEIVDISLKKKRTILTRDKGILKYSEVTHGYWIRNDSPKKQVIEVVKRFQLENNFKPFSRCTLCNGVLKGISKASVKEMVEKNVYENNDSFLKCGRCGKIYWNGSHYENIKEWIKKFK